MDRRALLKLMLAIVVLAAAGVLIARQLTRPGPAESDFSEGTFWLCTDPACGAEFTMSISDLLALQQADPGAPIQCPECRSAEVVRAIRCPACGRFIPRSAVQAEQPVCPRCGEALPSLTPDP